MNTSISSYVAPNYTNILISEDIGHIKSTQSDFNPSKALDSLIKRFEKNYDEKGNFDIDFSTSEFEELLNQNNNVFRETHDKEKEFGFIEKLDIDPESRVFNHADLHCNIKTVLESITLMQKRGYMDAEYRCAPNVYYQLLGDYVDKGRHGTETLALLILLRLINKDQVLLVRGNHETVEINKKNCAKAKDTPFEDKKLAQIIADSGSCDKLRHFYDTLRLAYYISQKNSDPEASREYALHAHTGFEPSMDTAPLLDDPAPRKKVAVPVTLTLSARIETLTKITPKNQKEEEQKIAALAIKKLVEQETTQDRKSDKGILLTAYNWAKVERDPAKGSTIHSMGTKWKLCAEDIKYYFRISSTKHTVKILIRGHDHIFLDLTYNDKTIVKTLPVGGDSQAVEKGPGPVKGVSWVMEPASKIRDWNRKVYARTPGSGDTQKLATIKLRHPPLGSIELNTAETESYT